MKSLQKPPGTNTPLTTGAAGVLRFLEKLLPPADLLLDVTLDDLLGLRPNGDFEKYALPPFENLRGL